MVGHNFLPADFQPKTYASGLDIQHESNSPTIVMGMGNNFKS